MIISLGSIKGSPGVTTLATALATVWPTERLLLETDTAGADLPFRLRRADNEVLQPEPSVADVAAAARMESVPADGLSQFGQATSLGFDVIPGLLTPGQYSGMRGLWPQLATACSSWPGSVLADLGQLSPRMPAWPMARASAGLVVVARYCAEGLFHLREQLDSVLAAVADPDRAQMPVAVAVTGHSRQTRVAERETKTLLESVGAPVAFAGLFATDNVDALWGGPVTRRLLRSATVASAGRICRELYGMLPVGNAVMDDDLAGATS